MYGSQAEDDEEPMMAAFQAMVDEGFDENDQRPLTMRLTSSRPSTRCFWPDDKLRTLAAIWFLGQWQAVQGSRKLDRGGEESQDPSYEGEDNVQEMPSVWTLG